MRIAFLEDRPLVIMDAINRLHESGLEIVTVFWFCDDSNGEDSTFRARVINQYRELGVSLKRINRRNFMEELDKWYQEKDVVFFFDADLSRDFNGYFDERINVQYALKKQEEAGVRSELFRIWVYTTGPAAVVAQIMSMFPGHYLPVREFRVRDKQVIFDNDYMARKVFDTILKKSPTHGDGIK